MTTNRERAKSWAASWNDIPNDEEYLDRLTALLDAAVAAALAKLAGPVDYDGQAARIVEAAMAEQMIVGSRLAAALRSADAAGMARGAKEERTNAERFARYIVWSCPNERDHACAQCYPNGSAVVAGFVCTVHAASAYTASVRP